MSPLENDANNAQQQAIDIVQGRMLRRLYQAWECTQVSRRGAYTARRTRALERYCHTASVTRVLAVCLLTPVPILVFVVAMEMLPLNPPSDGWRRNSGWILRYVFVFTLLTLSCLQQASSFLTTLNVTLGQALAITWICVSCYFIVLLAIMDVWVFPVPFVFELTGGVFGVVFVVCVVVVFGSQTLTRTPKFSTQMRVVYSISAVEGAMCLVYPAFSAAFHVLYGGWQLAFMLLLYFLKVLMRFLMVLVCCSSKDMEDKVRLQSRLPELVAFSTEIFHLVYLMTCLQGPHIPVWAATTLVLIDVLTSAFSVHRIIRRPAMTLILGPPKRSSVPGRRSLSAVVPVSGPPASALPPSPSGISDTASRLTNRVVTSASNIKLARRSLSRLSWPSSIQSGQSTSLSCAPSQRIEPTEKGLEMLSAVELTGEVTRFQTLSMTEYFILIEYVSCIVPLMVGIYTGELAQLPNAVYYPSVANMSPRELQEAQHNVAVYVVFQALSMVIFEEILRRRLQFPVMHQLAFVLETAAMDIQAKLMIIIPYCFFFFLEHNGVDFSFRFAWMHQV